ncbi:hypothetical protein ACLK19_18600 [Escherichia coli]
MTVMAVDDNPANLKLIGALLEDMVNMPNFAIAGIRRLNSGETDAVRFDLTNIQMPDMDGIRPASSSTSSPISNKRRLSRYSRSGMAGQKEKLLGAGMSDYSGETD